MTVGHSLRAVANILILYFVLTNAFTLVMREFFHFVKIRPDSFGGLEPHAHFQSWLTSFSVTARATTGEAWHKIMSVFLCFRFRPVAVAVATSR